ARTASCGARLGDLPVGQVEVALPGRPVPRCLPAAVDGAAVGAELPGETLPEGQRREVRRVPRQRPDAVADGHRIHAGDASRVEVVLGVRLAVALQADERYTRG